MQHLLLDTFRGFKRTIIPIARVNFLVGENSTGKTSVLGLIDLLSTPDFWFRQDFNVGGHEFGNFSDLVSAGSPPGTQFTLGFALDKARGANRPKSHLCYLITYHEEAGLPVPSFFGRLRDSSLVCLKRCGDSYRYQASKLNAKETPHSTPDMFAMLECKRDSDRAEFKEASGKLPARAPLIALLSVIESMESPEEADPERFPTPIPVTHLAWFAPIRTKPKRTYDAYMRAFSPEGEHTPYLLRKLLPRKKGEKLELVPFVKALRDFGMASGLFEDVLINEFSESSDSPFEVLIKLPHVTSLRINSVGYGVSQALPLVVEMLARPQGSWYAIQQPEVHLHPRAQAALGDLVYHLAEEDNKHFLIETHSDFTIDRFRMNFAREKTHCTTGQVLFFESAQKGNKLTCIGLLPNGEFSPEQPESFRRFFVREQMALLGL